MSSGEPVKVKLGDHEYALYRQRIGYLENRTRGLFARLQSGDVSASMLGERAYELLVIFIGHDRMMPEHEFRGYATREAFAAGDYADEYDKSPSFPEIEDAIRAAIKVNRFDLFASLGKFFSPEIVRATGDKLLIEAIESEKPDSGTSPESGSTTTTGSTPETSTTNDSTPLDSASDATVDPSGERPAIAA